MTRSLRLTLIVLIIGAGLVVSRSQADNEKPRAPLTAEEQQAELAKLREIFASVDMLPARDARWVEVETGPAEAKTWQKGWLLQESDTEIKLLEDSGWPQTFDKKKPTAKKAPTEVELPHAWAVRNADFAKHCREFMTDKKKEDKEDSHELGVYRFQRERAAADAAVVDSARNETPGT
jgi:hypothetical protein